MLPLGNINATLAMISFYHFPVEFAMDMRDIKSKVREMLGTGIDKRDVYAKVTSMGANEKDVARSIAAFPDPSLCAQYRIWVITLAVLIVLYELLGFQQLFEMKGTAFWIGLTVTASITALIVWGICTNRPGAYYAYLTLQFNQSLKLISMLVASPSIAVIIGFALFFGLMIFLIYTHNKVFPHLVLFWQAKKVKGQYSFLQAA